MKYHDSADGVIAQIKDKNYSKVLEAYCGNLLLVGVSYDKKTKKHSCMIEDFKKEKIKKKNY